jgi:ATP phosphoribosyltransferase regulatory subunit HisZ
MNIPADVQAELLAALGEKNIHGARAICERNRVDGTACERILQLIRTYGSVEETLSS